MMNISEMLAHDCNISFKGAMQLTLKLRRIQTLRECHADVLKVSKITEGSKTILHVHVCQIKSKQTSLLYNIAKISSQFHN